MKLEIKGKTKLKGGVGEVIAIGFLHDSLKNYFLVDSIKNELISTGKSDTFSARNIVNDIQLLNFFAQMITGSINRAYEEEKSENIQYKKSSIYNLKEALIETITATKKDKGSKAITQSSNSITLLVGCNINLSGKDFSHTSIKGANITNGLFHCTNFEGADLTDVEARNCFFVKTNFKYANLSGLNIGIFPNLESVDWITSVSFSPDGRRIVTGSRDNTGNYNNTAIIWDAKTGVQIGEPLKGHSSNVNSVCFSPDGNKIVTGSYDNTAIIWDAESGV